MYLYVKRASDICVAIISLFILSAIWLIVATLIKIDSNGPVLFKQQRFGKDKKPFTIYKFRTMTVEAPKNCATNDLDNAASFITRTGKIMRKLSIDELPQFLNVLKGEMSLVGPRPVILQETDLIYERDKYRANHCTPGITGWAQANGRDEVNIYEKARMDGEYADNFGLMMDLRCLTKTVETILFQKGYREGALPSIIPQMQPTTTPFYASINRNSKKINRPIRRRSTSMANTIDAASKANVA
jgi:O-antigen biosynthesis protein WbqP